MIDPPTLTRDEWRTLGIAALTAGAAALVGGLINWGIDEAKRRVEARWPSKKAGDT